MFWPARNNYADRETKARNQVIGVACYYRFNYIINKCNQRPGKRQGPKKDDHLAEKQSHWHACAAQHRKEVVAGRKGRRGSGRTAEELEKSPTLSQKSSPSCKSTEIAKAKKQPGKEAKATKQPRRRWPSSILGQK